MRSLVKRRMVCSDGARRSRSASTCRHRADKSERCRRRPPPRRMRRRSCCERSGWCWAAFSALLLLLVWSPFQDDSPGSTRSRRVLAANAQNPPPSSEHRRRTADSDDAAGDEFVRQVLKEESAHHGDQSDPYAMDEEIRAREDAEARRRSEQERLAKAEEDRIAREHADRVRRQRDEAFEREVSRMSEQQAKKARQKKRRDAKVVSRILRAASRDDHYAVLGLRNLDVRIPPRSLGIGGLFSLRFPGLDLFRVSLKDIRRAYRKLSVAVHPDRNRDGRANEAFIALENSASILSDEQRRREYDEAVRRVREQRQKQTARIAVQTWSSAYRAVSRGASALRTVLGPFAFPVAILGSLVV